MAQCERYYENLFLGFESRCSRSATKELEFKNGTIVHYCGYCARPHSKSEFLIRKTNKK